MCSEKEEPREKKGKLYCPNCGSPDLFYASGLPQIWSLWDCQRCGYRGPAVVEDSKLAEKIREEWERDHPDEKS